MKIRSMSGTTKKEGSLEETYATTPIPMTATPAISITWSSVRLATNSPRGHARLIKLDEVAAQA